MKNKKYFCKNKFLYFYLVVSDFLSSFFYIKRKREFTLDVNDSLNVLICNNGHLGDIVILMSAVQSLKISYPNVKVFLLTGSWNKSLLTNSNVFEGLFYYDHWRSNRSDSRFKNKLIRNVISLLKVRNELKNYKFDASIDTYNFYPNSAFLLYICNIPYRLGWKNGGYSGFYNKSINFNMKNKSMALYHIEIISKIFKKLQFDGSIYPIFNDLRDQPAHGRYCVIHPGTGDKKKQWDLDKWQGLIHKIHNFYDNIYITGVGDDEYNLATKLKLYPNVYILVNELSISEFSNLLKNASLLLCMDSLAAHLAAPYKTNTIIISTAINYTELWKPLNEKVLIVKDSSLTCSPCISGCETMECIKNISIDDVMRHVEVYKLEFN